MSGTPEKPLRVAMVVNDERDQFSQHERSLPYFGPAPQTLIDAFQQVPELELHLISCERRPVVPSPRLSENTYFHPVFISRWDYLRSLYFGSTLRIRKALRRIRPHVVHGQGTERFCGIAAAFSAFPNLTTIHGNMRAVARALGARRLSFHGITAMLESLTLRKTGGAICLSSYTRQQVAGLARQVWEVPNAVGETFFRIERHEDEIPRLFCVGTICPYKNQNALIRALDPLAAPSGLRLALAGPLDGTSYSAEFQQLVAARPWCEYLGRLSPERIRRELGRAFLLVHPSLEDNCPMVILEAMAAGVPVVASTCGGIPDLVLPDQTGLLCDPRDLGHFRVALQDLLSDPARARQLGEQGRTVARDRFAPERVARRHLEIYRELLFRHPR